MCGVGLCLVRALWCGVVLCDGVVCCCVVVVFGVIDW